jgi:non-ribosomal peptide synthetase component F
MYPHTPFCAGPLQGSIPSVLQLLAPHMAARRSDLALQQLVSSGELLPADLARDLLAALPPSCRLLNLYGSTEVSADCTCLDVRRWAGSSDGGDGGGSSDSTPGSQWVPVGKPISNSQVVVCRADSSHQHQREAVPWGEEGVVWVAGRGLAAGYHGAPDPDAAARFEEFTPHTSAAAAGAPSFVAGAVASGEASGGGGAVQQPRRWFNTGDFGRLLFDGE